MADTNVVVRFLSSKRYNGYILLDASPLKSFVEMLPSTVKAWRISRNSMKLHQIIYYQIESNSQNFKDNAHIIAMFKLFSNKFRLYLLLFMNTYYEIKRGFIW